METVTPVVEICLEQGGLMEMTKACPDESFNREASGTTIHLTLKVGSWQTRQKRLLHL
jgi:hypothetical protein